MAHKKEIIITCSRCGFEFSTADAVRECSNCFACTGCEVYQCPSCGDEVVVRPVRQPGQDRSSTSQRTLPEMPEQ